MVTKHIPFFNIDYT